MSGRFPLYTDADVRGPLIKQLRNAGWDIVRAIDEYPERTQDPIHFHRAADLGRVLVTSDEHQEALAVEWYEAGRPFPGLIIWRQALNEQMGYGELLKAFEELAKQDAPQSQTRAARQDTLHRTLGTAALSIGAKVRNRVLIGGREIEP